MGAVLLPVLAAFYLGGVVAALPVAVTAKRPLPMLMLSLGWPIMVLGALSGIVETHVDVTRDGE